VGSAQVQALGQVPEGLDALLKRTLDLAGTG
jgi:hypothetical protein